MKINRMALDVESTLATAAHFLSAAEKLDDHFANVVVSHLQSDNDLVDLVQVDDLWSEYHRLLDYLGVTFKCKKCI